MRNATDTSLAPVGPLKAAYEQFRREDAIRQLGRHVERTGVAAVKASAALWRLSSSMGTR